MHAECNLKTTHQSKWC